jgi:NAD-dependent DNA ligase
MTLVDNLVKQLQEYNAAYRAGDSIISDAEYDILVEQLEELDPTNPYLDTIGIQISDKERERKLPIPMASMNKVKSIEELYDWARLKGISLTTNVILTPKFDGLSLCVDEIKLNATTRGDGQNGQASDEHFKLIKNHLNKESVFAPFFAFTYGEVMMSKTAFSQKYAANFANPRNLVAGLINNKQATESLKDTSYIKYGAVLKPEFKDRFVLKHEILNALNNCQEIQVPWIGSTIGDLSEDFLINTFKDWSIDYELDGIILEIDDLKLQERLGRERSGNPVWARAFKSPQFEQSAITTVTGISWNISKQGYLKPTLHINPVRLDGVTVSNVTGNNARFVKDMGLGIGAVIRVVRSGMVIPLVKEVIESVDFVMPDIQNIGWNENEVELVTLTETNEQKFKQLVSFFEILEVENAGEGVFAQLWDAGYQTVKQILELKPSNMEKLEGFGKRKAEIVYNAIQSKIKYVELSKLQHATGIFKMLGSKKLALLERFSSKPTLQQVMEIEGFAEKSAQAYLDGYDKFFDFIKDLPITISEKKETEKLSNELDGKSFCFTGLRLKELESIIESKGGRIASGVSKNLTYLVAKDPGSGSSKLVKAQELGVILLSVQELEQLLK